MTKYYEIHAKFGKGWATIHRTERQNDALHYVKEHSSTETQYPMRVVRVVKTIVFNGEK
jgi:uncharacterized protein YbdZ (MbtH family)